MHIALIWVHYEPHIKSDVDVAQYHFDQQRPQMLAPRPYCADKKKMADSGLREGVVRDEKTGNYTGPVTFKSS